jgi:hypothetical protein
MRRVGPYITLDKLKETEVNQKEVRRVQKTFNFILRTCDLKKFLYAIYATGYYNHFQSKNKFM